jgi:hypothetical protein
MKTDLKRAGGANRYGGRRRDPSHWPRNNCASKKSRGAVKPAANSLGTAPTGGEPSTTIDVSRATPMSATKRHARGRTAWSCIRRATTKDAGLIAIARLSRQTPQSRTIEIIPQQNRSRHGKPPSVCQVESDRGRFGNPLNESPIQRLGIRCLERFGSVLELGVDLRDDMILIQHGIPRHRGARGGAHDWLRGTSALIRFMSPAILTDHNANKMDRLTCKIYDRSARCS